MSIEFDVWIKFVSQIGQSLAKHGFRKIVLLNGHGGNAAAIDLVAQNIAESAGKGCLVAAFSYWDVSGEQIDSIRTSAQGGMGHSCELETSLQLYLRDGLVKMERAVKNPRTRSSRFDSLDLADNKKHVLFYRSGGGGVAGDPGEFGTMGDPTVATKEKGRRFFEAIVGQVSEVLRDISEKM